MNISGTFIRPIMVDIHGNMELIIVKCDGAESRKSEDRSQKSNFGTSTSVF